MNKLLIIDNEPVIREGLKNVIPWEKYGYLICGTAVDGRDGLNKIRDYQPNLILLDIRMPGLSGIELVQQVRKEKIKCEIIILSAYSSFSYAKELMKLGIDYYLLKPIKEEELIEILEKIEMKRQQEKQIEDQLKLFKQMNEEQSFRLLLENKFNEVPEDMKNHLREKTFQMARFALDLREVNIQWIRELVSQNNEQMKLIAKNGYNYLLFINPDYNFVMQTLTEMINRFKLYGDDHINIILTENAKGPEKVGMLYEQTFELANIHFSFSDEEIFTYKHLKDINEHDVTKVEEIDKEKVLHFIEFGDYFNINQKGKKLENFYKMAKYPRDKVQVDIIEWFFEMIKLIKENYPSEETINEHIFAQNIYSQPNLKKIIKYICKELRTISLSINKVYLSQGNIVDKVINYINHYYYKDLSLKFVADLFHYNNAYLGKVFKSQTGKYFNEYLHEVRIENAKQLLKNENHKVYEIAKIVGYSNSDYFYKNFKEYEGMSPKEYQMKHRNKEG